jgi:hypothetical protein
MKVIFWVVNKKTMGLTALFLAMQIIPSYASGPYITANPTTKPQAAPENPTEDDEKFDEKDIFAEVISGNLLEEMTGSSFTLSAGLDFSRGKYNLPVDTRVLYLPLTFKFNNGPWSFSLSGGYSQSNSPDNVFLGPDSKPYVDRNEIITGSRRKNSGFGDLYLSATYSIDSLYDNQIYVDFTGRIKIPTANSSQGLGTGKVDYTAQIDVSKLFGNIMPFATVGYRILGKTPEYTLQNSFFFSVGASYYLTYDTSIGISYDYRQSATFGYQDPKEIYGYFDMQINSNWGMNIYGVIGLDETAPDAALGFQLRYKF